MAVIPPWLDVKPSDFLAAAEAGSRLGQQIAARQTEANLTTERLRAQLAEAGMRANAEAGGRSLEAQRIAQAAEQANAERALRQWETEQQIKHGQDVIAGENARSQNMIDAQNQRAHDSLAERAYYGTNMLDVRREANRIAQERADAAANKPTPADYKIVTEHTKEVPPTKIYDINEPGVHNWFTPNTPPKSFTTTNQMDLASLPQGSSIVTNTVPGSGSPALTISRRIPINQDPYALSTTNSAPNIPQGHIDYLQKNPTAQVISDFNDKYGEDAADNFLRGDDESQADTQ